MSIESGFSLAASAARLLETLMSLPSKLRSRRVTTEIQYEKPGWVAKLADRERPLDFELIPLWFELGLNQAIPQIAVNFQAVNYLSKPLTLISLQVPQIQVSGCPVLRSISTELTITLPARRSRLVRCDRTLVDAEVRAVGGADGMYPYNGSVTVAARYSVGRSQFRYGPFYALGVNGWISSGTQGARPQLQHQRAAQPNKGIQPPAGSGP